MVKFKKPKKDKKPPPADGAAMEDYFADSGLGAEELVAEGPPPRKRRRPDPEERWFINIPALRSILRACRHRFLLRRCTSFWLWT